MSSKLWWYRDGYVSLPHKRWLSEAEITEGDGVGARFSILATPVNSRHTRYFAQDFETGLTFTCYTLREARAWCQAAYDSKEA